MQVKDKSHFIFIAISSGPNEVSQDKERFIKDIFHSIYILQKIGVSGQNITIISDWASQEWENNGFRPLIPTAPADAYSKIQAIDTENLFIITSCHGGLCGIGGPTSIRPHDLTEAIKTNQKVQNCVVFFGQCYAGVFNYTNLTDEDKKIVYIGATGMRSGLSSYMKWDITPSDSLEWIANISVFYMFEWLEHPVDVDNDGNFSIMDLYKYVSYKTNNKTEEIEKNETRNFLQSQIRYEIQKAINQGQNTILAMLDAAANQALMRYIIPHQDCWILNAIPASSMCLKF